MLKKIKIIITVILIIFSVNFSFSFNKKDLEKIKSKLENTKYKEKISKIDILIKKTNIIKLENFNKKVKKSISENKIQSDKKLLLVYIYYKILDKKNKEKIAEEKTKKYNWIDISNKLKIKHLQEMPLSCEISATSDILTFLENKKIKESDLLKILQKSEFYNKIAIKKESWEKIWWNPQKGFVWYINKLPNWKEAMQGYMTWYWVLENPIANVYEKYWYETKIHKNWKISELLEELEKWNMIQLWWDICTNPEFYNWKEIICKTRWKLTWNKSRALKWQYKDENWKYIEYNWLNWEHAFYLLWYKWNYLNPTHIIVWDTMTWKHTYPTSEWMRKWWKMQYRSIIIYAK